MAPTWSKLASLGPSQPQLCPTCPNLDPTWTQLCPTWHQIGPTWLQKAQLNRQIFDFGKVLGFMLAPRIFQKMMLIQNVRHSQSCIKITISFLVVFGYFGLPKNIKNRSNMGAKIDRKLNIPWSCQKTPLEVHLDHILGPCGAKLRPKLRQVGTKLGQVGAKLGQFGSKLCLVGLSWGLSWAKLRQVGLKSAPN